MDIGILLFSLPNIAIVYSTLCRVLFFVIMLPAFIKIIKELRVQDDLVALRFLITGFFCSLTFGNFSLFAYGLAKYFFVPDATISSLASIISSSSWILMAICVALIYFEWYKTQPALHIEYNKDHMKNIDKSVIMTFFTIASIAIISMLTAALVMMYQITTTLSSLADLQQDNSRAIEGISRTLEGKELWKEVN